MAQSLNERHDPYQKKKSERYGEQCPRGQSFQQTKNKILDVDEHDIRIRDPQSYEFKKRRTAHLFQKRRPDGKSVADRRKQTGDDESGAYIELTQLRTLDRLEDLGEQIERGICYWEVV